MTCLKLMCLPSRKQLGWSGPSTGTSLSPLAARGSGSGRGQEQDKSGPSRKNRRVGSAGRTWEGGKHNEPRSRIERAKNSTLFPGANNLGEAVSNFERAERVPATVSGTTTPSGKAKSEGLPRKVGMTRRGPAQCRLGRAAATAALADAAAAAGRRKKRNEVDTDANTICSPQNVVPCGHPV